MKGSAKIPVVSFFSFLKGALEIVKNPLPFHHDNFEAKGDTFALQLGFTNHVLFSREASFLKYVLQTNQRNYTKTEIQTRDLAKYLGRGLLTAEGALWKKQRKLLQPSFHKKHLDKLLQGMQVTIKEELAKIPKGAKVSVEPYFGRLAFQVVAKSLFSGDVDPAIIDQLRLAVEASQKMLVKELRQPYLGWWFRSSGQIQKHLDMVGESRKLIQELIQHRKTKKEKTEDLLDLLLAAQYDDGSFMAESQMIDEILILLTAGHETTCNALCFTCQLLAKHPQYQEQLYKEAVAIDEKQTGLMEQLLASKLTKQVLEESMRLYPPAYFIDRKNIAADTFNGKHYPANTSILFSVIEIHRHKDLWQDPLAFKPERFDAPAKHYSDFYFPFGAGPRMCIGNNFAMLEMQLVIAAIMQHYLLEDDQAPIDITPLITLKPKNAFVTFKNRKHVD